MPALPDISPICQLDDPLLCVPKTANKVTVLYHPFQLGVMPEKFFA